ncbi:TolC family protein [Verticiella sediminum]|uniref:Protein CyaE n=1 Tax=Verticiella sediminum TaxID=1247510 RepID=A0A556A6H8_9BURK|nr:TolC family protein [Verticiella sediminum]TSH88493.1 TolC family protein [Verticiella sediminum]
MNPARVARAGTPASARARAALLRAAGTALLGLALPGAALAGWLDDPLDAMPPVLAEARMEPAAAGSPACDDAAALPRPLTLADAVQRALCQHPRTRQAWAWIAREAAAVGVARSAYLPTLDATASVAHAEQTVRYPDLPGLSSELRARSTQAGLQLNWVLYDFGLRAAHLERARQILNAASAARSRDVQAVFLETAEAYRELQAARALAQARRDALAIAQQSLDAAEGRHAGGVGSLSDRLLAETSYGETRLRLAEAEGEERRLSGRLASLLALAAWQPLELSPLQQEAPPGSGFDQAVDSLIGEAMRTHPEVREAQAQLLAAQAEARAARAEGRPRISLFATADRQDTPIERVSSRQVIRNQVVGLQVSIPLFEGFAGGYRARGAQAEIEAREAALAQAEQDVAMNVWDSYQAMRMETDRLEASQMLAEIAGRSHEVAEGRYKAGVGSMLELLAAQNSLLEARQAQVSALARWHTARLRLGAHLARLGTTPP